MAEYIETQERIFTTKNADLHTVYFKDEMMRYFLKSVTIGFVLIGSLLLLFTSSYETYKVGIFLIYTALFNSIGLYVSMYLGKTRFKSDSLVPNEKKETFMFNQGVEVKKHLGDAIKSLAVPDNLTGRILLRSAEKVKRMAIIVGKAGSGKTVLLRGILEEILKIGAGAFIIDAKGTVDEIKRFMAMIYKYGREKDLLIMNFTNLNNTHTINFLSYGNAMMLKEILMVLSSSTEQKWKQVDEDFISAVLKLLVYKRDNENLKLSLDAMRDYLTLTRLLKEAIKYRKSKDRGVIDYIRFVCTSLELDYDEFVSRDTKDAEYWKSCQEKLTGDSQGVYEGGLAAKNWGGVLTTLGSDYGAIFNVEYPDIDLFEAIQNNKIILVSLPTMESEETAKKIGKLILGIIKSVADQKIKRTSESKIPFVFLLDEFGSFAITGFGRFMSKARALAMPMFLFFQSTSQVDVVDDGKGMEKQEIFDNSDAFICLKNTDSKLAEYLNETVPPEIFLDRSYKEVRKEVDSNSDLSKESDYQKTEEKAIKTEYFSKLNNGEMYFCSGAEAYKAVAKAPSDFNLTYKLKNISAHIPLLQVYPKEKLRKDLGGQMAVKIFPANSIYKREKKVS